MSNAQSGASYEALLVDRISAPAQQIVQVLAQLDAAFQQVTLSSQPFASNMQVIAAAMQTATRQPREHVEGLVGTFNRVSEASSQLGSAAGRAIEGLGNTIRTTGVVAIGVTTAVAAGLYDVVIAASDATETINAFNVVLQTNTRAGKNAAAWSVDFAKTLGRSSLQTKQSMTTYQSFWKGLGATNENALKLTKTMVQLQTDFGSFFNVTDDESLRRFIAALSGSSEVLDQFGINIRENALEAKSMQMGFGGNVRKLTEYQKAMVRAAIITEVLGKRIGALGDAARTQFEFQNQIRSFTGQLLDLRVALGNLIIPQVKPYLQAVTLALSDLRQRAEQLRPEQIRQFLSGLLTLAGVGASLVALGTVIATLGSIVSVAAIAFAGLATSVGAMVAGGPIAALIVGVTALAAALGGLIAIDVARGFNWGDMLASLKGHMESAVATVEAGVDAIRKAIAAGDYASAWQALKLTGVVVFHEMALSFVEIMGAAVDSLASTLAKPFTLKGWSEALGGLTDGKSDGKNYVDRMRESIEQAKRDLQNLRESLPEPQTNTNQKGIADSLLNVAGLGEVITAEQAWNRMKTTVEAMKEGFKAMAEHAEKIRDKAMGWADEMRSPQEKFVAELRNIELMASIARQHGRNIDAETIKRAQMQAAEKLMNDLPKPAKFQASSVGSFSRAMAANAGAFAPAFDAQLNEQKKTNQLLDFIRRGVDAMANNQVTF